MPLQDSITSRILSRDDTVAQVSSLKADGKKIVFTNGCFDILHRGHVSYLAQAKAQGDVLVLGLNTDESVRRLKGPSRPLNAEADRAYVLAALRSVDIVTLFNEETPEALIHMVRPDVLVKGADYTIATVVGAEFVMSYGGSVYLAPVESGFSTTNIIQAAKVK